MEDDSLCPIKYHRSSSILDECPRLRHLLKCVLNHLQNDKFLGWFIGNLHTAKQWCWVLKNHTKKRIDLEFHVSHIIYDVYFGSIGLGETTYYVKDLLG